MVDIREGRGIEGLEVVTDNTTLDYTYQNVICNPVSAGDITITLPPVAEVPYRVFKIRNISDYIITVDGDGAETIDGDATISLFEKNCSFEKYFQAYDNTGGADVTTVQTVVFDTQIVAHAPFSYNTTTGILTINRSGLYKVMYDMSTDISTGTARSTSTAYLELDPLGGGSYAEVSGTRAFMYNRTLANAENTGTMTRLIDLNATDLLRVRAVRLAGTDTIITKVDGSRFTAEYVDKAFEEVTLLADVDNSEWKIIGAI